jgi:uncharacterized protein (TIGR02646 family)
MLQLVDKPLSNETTASLQSYQKDVDQESDFNGKVKKAKESFPLKNRKTNPAFREVRENLTIMSGGTIRCNYCEDSKADEVEHIFPKNYYPEKCFVWENYCYACGPCNGPKNDQFAVLDNRNVETELSKLPSGSAIPNGLSLVIDPRKEDPMNLLILDMVNTFRFTPVDKTHPNIRRANYTITILGLNSRNYLIRARKNAFASYKARLFEYVTKKENQAPQAELTPLIDAQKSDHHQTVWAEMKRQKDLHLELQDLFKRAPEALNW